MSKLSVNLVNEPEVTEKNVKFKSVLEDTVETSERQLQDEPSVVIANGSKRQLQDVANVSSPSNKRWGSGNIIASSSAALYAPMPWSSNLSSSAMDLGNQLSLDGICLQALEPTGSRSIPDDEITFNIKQPPGPKIEHYIERSIFLYKHAF